MARLKMELLRVSLFPHGCYAQTEVFNARARELAFHRDIEFLARGQRLAIWHAS